MCRKTRALVLSASLLFACSKNADTADGPVTMPPPGDGSGPPADLRGAAPPDLRGTTPPDGAAPDNSISGSVKGHKFDTVAAAYRIGMPDDASTVVVYLFDRPIACAELAMVGWDARITDKTQALELKAFGTMPNTYKVVKSMTPAAGEAAVFYTLSSRTGTPTETQASGITLTLTRVVDAGEATGSFDLKFGAEALTGTFKAPYCPEGHEP